MIIRSSPLISRKASSPPEFTGALKSPPDDSDWIFERVAEGIGESKYICDFPDEYDMRKLTKPSRNQGDRGTCAAFTAAAIKEIQEGRENSINEWMSPEFIYYHRENKPASGMYGRNVFQILQKIGTVPESAFPYRTTESAEAPSKKLYEQAARYRIANYARITTVDGVKRALLELGPCYLLLPLYKSRPTFWRGSIKEKCSGGHAVAIVGYNKEGFILRNSWGPHWNGDGHIIFPYEEWGIHWECWVSIDEKTERLALGNDGKKDACSIS